MVGTRELWAPAMMGDGLGELYSSLADDDSQDVKVRESSVLISVAENQLNDGEDLDEAMRAAKEALALAREMGDKDAVADTLRLVIKAQCGKSLVARYEPTAKAEEVSSSILKQAEKMARDELANFKESSHDRGQACMLLSVAEVCLAQRTRKSRSAAAEPASNSRLIFQRLGDQKMEAHALLVLFSLHAWKKERQEAKDAAEAALHLYRSIDSRLGEANALHALSLAHALQGTYAGYDQALKVANQSMDLFESVGLRKLQGLELVSIAELHIEMESPYKAVACAKQALDIFLDTGASRRLQACAMVALAQGYEDYGEAAKAVEETEAMASRFANENDRRLETILQEVIAFSYLANNSPEEALNVASLGRTYCEDVKDREWEAGMSLTLSKVYCDLKQKDNALQAAEDALALYQGLDNMEDLQAICCYTLSYISVLMGDFKKALQSANKCRDMFSKLGDRAKEAHGMLQAASIHGMDSNAAEGIRVASSAREIFLDIEDPRGEAMALHTLVELHVSNDEFEKALDLAKTRRSVLRDAGFRRDEARSIASIAHILMKDQRPAEAARVAYEGLRLAHAARDQATEVHMMIMAIQADIAVILESGGVENTRRNIVQDTYKVTRRAVTLAEKVLKGKFVPHTLFWQAHVLLLSLSEECNAIADKALDLFQQANDKHGEAHTLILLAQIHITFERQKEAEELLRKSMTLFQEDGDNIGAFEANSVLQKLYSDMGMFRVQQQVQQRQDMDAIEEAPQASQAAGPIVKKLDPQQVVEKLMEMVRDSLGTDDEVEADNPLMDSGMDSLSSVQFRNEVSAHFSKPLPASLMFDFPTIRSMGHHIVEISNE